MEVRRGDRSRNGVARGWRKTRERERAGGNDGATVCEGKDEAKRRAERAEASARSFPFWGRRGGRKAGGGGGANSRDINSVLAPGGLQRRKLRAEGEYYSRIPLRPAFIPPSFPPSLSPSIPPPPPLPLPRSNHPHARRGWLGGVTNQRLAIVNSTCAVKQLINK